MQILTLLEWRGQKGRGILQQLKQVTKKHELFANTYLEEHCKEINQRS